MERGAHHENRLRGGTQHLECGKREGQHTNVLTNISGVLLHRLALNESFLAEFLNLVSAQKVCGCR